jgi:hypothetical protein
VQFDCACGTRVTVNFARNALKLSDDVIVRLAMATSVHSRIFVISADFDLSVKVRRVY